MHEIMTGALAMAFAVAGLFFLRFWRKSRERLFLIFAMSFFLLAVNRVGQAVAPDALNGDHFYWIRLFAFVLILIAVVDKNRSPRPPKNR